MGGWTNTTVLPLHVFESTATQEFNVTGQNIGNIFLAEIHGYKFLDKYGNGPFGGPNGKFDVGESGLGNWRITLQGRTDTGDLVSRVAFTDNVVKIGFYQFLDVAPGMYWVNETLMIGYYATTPIANLIIVPNSPHGPFSFNVSFGNTIPAPDPQVNFVMYKGWNLWSMPVANSTITAKKLLQLIGPSGGMVTKLDKTQGKYVSYVTGYGDAYDFPITLGEGYYVYVSQDTVFNVKGVLTGSGTSSVQKGWNIIGYDKMEQTTASKLLSSVTGCKASMITYLDSATKTYHSYVKGYSSLYDFAITPGRAYFIYVDGAGTVVY
jgi:hypothetical protein